jgi:hypothetical protein
VTKAEDYNAQYHQDKHCRSTSYVVNFFIQPPNSAQWRTQIGHRKRSAKQQSAESSPIVGSLPPSLAHKPKTGQCRESLVNVLFGNGIDVLVVSKRLCNDL